MVKSRMRWTGLLSGLVCLLLPLGLSGCLETAPPKTETPSIGASPSAELTPAPSGEPTKPDPSPAATELEVFWVKDNAQKLELTPVKVTVDTAETPEAQVRAALDRLLKGSANSDVTSAIPVTTKLNRVKIKADGIHVDLSKAFTSGGGSASMQARLGQVIYTASSLKTSEPVWISVEGEPLTVLGGEGLEVSQPMTRSEFNKSFP